MKKDLIFKLGIIALILTLITMPLVSGTYAKYVTQADGNATARVAKWGVQIDLDASRMFGLEYYGLNSQNIYFNMVPLTGDKNYGLTVKSEEIVVAPGTKGQIAFTLSGKPEVATKLEILPEFKFVDDNSNNNWKVQEKDYFPLNFAFRVGQTKTVSSSDDFTDIEYLYLSFETNEATVTTKQLQTVPCYYNYSKMEILFQYLNDLTENISPNANIRGLLYELLKDENGSGFGLQITPTGDFIFEWIWPFERTEENIEGYITWPAMEAAVKAPEVLGANATIVEIYDYADTTLGNNSVPPEITIEYTIRITQID